MYCTTFRLIVPFKKRSHGVPAGSPGGGGGASLKEVFHLSMPICVLTELYSFTCVLVRGSSVHVYVNIIHTYCTRYKHTVTIRPACMHEWQIACMHDPLPGGFNLEVTYSTPVSPVFI
jgi:hypothetical protein